MTASSLPVSPESNWFMCRLGIQKHQSVYFFFGSRGPQAIPAAIHMCAVGFSTGTQARTFRGNLILLFILVCFFLILFKQFQLMV